MPNPYMKRMAKQRQRNKGRKKRDPPPAEVKRSGWTTKDGVVFLRGPAQKGGVRRGPATNQKPLAEEALGRQTKARGAGEISEEELERRIQERLRQLEISNRQELNMKRPDADKRTKGDILFGILIAVIFTAMAVLGAYRLDKHLSEKHSPDKIEQKKKNDASKKKNHYHSHGLI